MSTSVIHPGTTPKAGRSGRFLGMAAVGLAVVIAVGVAFAVNQGNEATVPGVDTRLDQGLGESYMRQNPVDYPTELRRLLGQVEAVNRASHPAFNIEKHRLEQARAIGATESPGANIEKYRLEQARAIGATESPGANIEKYRLEQAAADRAQDAWSQRLQGLADWFATQDAAGTKGNLLEGTE